MHLWAHRWTIQTFISTLSQRAHDIADILLVAFLLYRLMMFAKGTRAWQIIYGLMFFLIAFVISNYLQLAALQWLLNEMVLLGPVAIVILFYPELRHALEEVGRLGLWGRGVNSLEKEAIATMIGELVRAADSFSDKKIGALIVLERETGLSEYIDNGTTVNGQVSAHLLGAIFYPGVPLHDGAAIVRRDKVIAAGCTLPLSDSRDVGSMVHTRHKAALGISEISDAIVVVVSEETGIISIMFDGKMQRGLRHENLRDQLMQTYMGRERVTFRRRRSPAVRNPSRPRPNLSVFMPTFAIHNGKPKPTAKKIEEDPADPQALTDPQANESIDTAISLGVVVELVDQQNGNLKSTVTQTEEEPVVPEALLDTPANEAINAIRGEAS